MDTEVAMQSNSVLYIIKQSKPGHLTGCAGADPHLSVKSASSASSEHFPHKNEKFA